MTREELEEGRVQGYRTYGYKKAYCDLTPSCESCDRIIRNLCRIIRFIEDIQTKRILKLCK